MVPVLRVWLFMNESFSCLSLSELKNCLEINCMQGVKYILGLIIYSNINTINIIIILLFDKCSYSSFTNASTIYNIAINTNITITTMVAL